MKQKRVKKYFSEHPEALEEIRAELLSYSDTTEPISDEDIPDFEAFVARNEALTQIFNPTDRRQKNFSYYCIKPSYRIRKAAIPMALALLLGLFLAFTSPGNALADSIYKTVIHWFGHSVNIQYGSDTEPAEQAKMVTQYYDTASDVRAALSIKLADNAQAALRNQIEVDRMDQVSYIIRSDYIAGSDEFSITQTSFRSETLWDSNIQYDDGCVVDETVGGVQYVGYVLNHHGYAIAYTEKMSVQVSSPDTDLERFISFIRGISVE